MMNQLLKVFPDDKPITAISVVEDPSKCPPGFYVVSVSRPILLLGAYFVIKLQGPILLTYTYVP